MENQNTEGNILKEVKTLERHLVDVLNKYMDDNKTVNLFCVYLTLISTLIMTIHTMKSNVGERVELFNLANSSLEMYKNDMINRHNEARDASDHADLHVSQHQDRESEDSHDVDFRA